MFDWNHRVFFFSRIVFRRPRVTHEATLFFSKRRLAISRLFLRFGVRSVIYCRPMLLFFREALGAFSRKLQNDGAALL